jgi:hypothetical protein
MEARLAFLGHALMENRSDLIVDACLMKVCGHGELVAALAIIDPHSDRPRPITLGADRGYDAADFVLLVIDRVGTGLVLRNMRLDRPLCHVRQPDQRHLRIVAHLIFGLAKIQRHQPTVLAYTVDSLIRDAATSI